MDIALVGILIGSVFFLAGLVFLMCRDAMSGGWLEFSTQSRRQMREREKPGDGASKAGSGKEAAHLSWMRQLLAWAANSAFAPLYNKKKQAVPAQAGKKGVWENAYVRIFLVSIGIYALIFAYFFASSPTPQFEFLYEEAPLQKNAQLLLMEGQYVYEVRTGENVLNVTYWVSKDPYCSGYLVIGTDGKSALCIEKSARAAGEASQGNMSASQSGMLYLSAPWMLAVEESWRWEVRAIIREKNSGKNYTSIIGYEWVANESVFGREAYRVQIKNDGNDAGFFLIDVQTRVMLGQNSSIGQVALVKAPFLK